MLYTGRRHQLARITADLYGQGDYLHFQRDIHSIYEKHMYELIGAAKRFTTGSTCSNYGLAACEHDLKDTEKEKLTRCHNSLPLRFFTVLRVRLFKFQPLNFCSKKDQSSNFVYRLRNSCPSKQNGLF